jgi:hypothetical protein
LIVVVRGEPDAGFGSAYGVGDGCDYFKGEADSVFDRAAVGVGAFVYVVVEELLEEVAICPKDLLSVVMKYRRGEVGKVPMDFNTIETSGDAAFCSFSEFFGHGMDLVDGHGSGWIG